MSGAVRGGGRRVRPPPGSASAVNNLDRYFTYKQAAMDTIIYNLRYLGYCTTLVHSVIYHCFKKRCYSPHLEASNV